MTTRIQKIHNKSQNKFVKHFILEANRQLFNHSLQYN